MHALKNIQLLLLLIWFYHFLSQHAVEALWLTIKDLLEEPNSAEVRQLTLEFITALVSGQVLRIRIKYNV